MEVSTLSVEIGGTDAARGRVLVLVADPVVRLAFAGLLRADGFEVHGAATGPDALVLLQEYAFAAMLCDNQLEGETGIDLLPAALALRPDMSVVMLVPPNDPLVGLRALELGALDYITKPVHRSRLRDVVRMASEEHHRSTVTPDAGPATIAGARVAPPADETGSVPTPALAMDESAAAFVILVPPPELPTFWLRLQYWLSSRRWLPWQFRQTLYMRTT